MHVSTDLPLAVTSDGCQNAGGQNVQLWGARVLPDYVWGGHPGWPPPGCPKLLQNEWVIDDQGSPKILSGFFGIWPSYI